LSSDPGLWAEVSQSDIEYWIAKDSAGCRNHKVITNVQRG
jgi:hypothetical protein